MRNKITWFYILTIVITIITVFGKFLYVEEQGFLAYYEDDFFYYLKIAKNLYEHQFSSLNGIYPTNGYHPLWLFVLYIFTHISELFNISIFYLVALTSVISSFIIIKYALKISIYFLGERNIAFLSLIPILHVSLNMLSGGMETNSVIPLLFYILYAVLTWDFKSNKYLFLFGLLTSITLLSRLDSILFIILLIPAWCFYFKIKFKQLMYFSIGLSPFILYLLSNYIIFDTIMPVSGMAKQLKISIMPDFTPILSVIGFHNKRILIAKLPFILLIINIIFLLYKTKNFNEKEKILIISSSFFPIIFLIHQTIFSGWYLFMWYYYIFIPVYMTFVVVIEKFIKLPKIKFLIIIIFLIFSLVRQIQIYYQYKPENFELYVAAKHFQEFEKTHKGIYAMGDRAAIVAFLIESPLIQLEGIVMHKDYLNDLKTLDILPLLKKYNVDYYISNMGKQIDENKWFSKEPSNTLTHIHKSKGYLYCEPIDSITTGNDWHNYIFYIPDCK